MPQHDEHSFFGKWLRSMLGSEQDAKSELDVAVDQLKKQLPYGNEVTSYNAELADQWVFSRRIADKVVQNTTAETALIDLCNERNGFVRERALRRLRQSFGPKVLGVAIERLNDFQPRVRDAALDVYLAHLCAGRADDFLTCIEAICALQDKTRLDHTALLKPTADLLMVADDGNHLKQTFLKLRGRFARMVLDWMLARLNRDEVIKVAFTHTDPSVRSMALATTSDIQPQTRLTAIQYGLADRSSSLRATALRLTLDTDMDASEKLALCKRLLLDQSVGVRDTARWYANKSGFDVLAYLEAISVRPDLSQTELFALLSEAARSKPKFGQKLAESQLVHPRAAIRMLALKILLRTQPERQSALLDAAWQDTSPKLRKCILGLVAEEVVVDGDALHEMAKSAWLRQDRLVAEVLSNKLGHWGRFALDLELSQYPESREHALKQFSRLNYPNSWLIYSRPYLVASNRIQTLLEFSALKTDLIAFPHLIEGLKKSGCWPINTLQ